MDKEKNYKIEVIYPNGERDCQNVVADTYRKAISFMGLEAVRALGKTRNSINIVSTREEMENSTGKKKEKRAISLLGKSSELGICTEFATKEKYNLLVEANEALKKGLIIHLLTPEEAKMALVNSKDESKRTLVTSKKKVETTLVVPEEEVDSTIKEGLMKEFQSSRYERNPKARKLCIEHYGSPVVCQICGFDFEKTYGKREDMLPYIEVHHIRPLNEQSGEEHSVDCTKELIPVCANCHRMLHHLRPNVLHPDELREILRLNKEKE